MAESAAHTEAPAGHTTFPPFQAEHFPSQLFWLTITFVLLYVLMAKIALPRIGSIFAERSRLIGDDLKAADRYKEQADTAHAAYEKSLADARTRAQGIASVTREQRFSCESFLFEASQAQCKRSAIRQSVLDLLMRVD